MPAAAVEEDVFRAIAHPDRRRMLALLAERDRPVTEIAAQFSSSRPQVSQHLKVLLDAGLVRRTRAGREQRYTFVPEGLQQVRDWLRGFERFWDERLQRLGAYLDEQDRR